MREALMFLPILFFLGCEPGAPKSELRLRSEAFADGASIPTKFTEDGADASPALAWSGTPTGTRAFALVVEDPDAPGGTWVHWVLYDLSASTHALEEGQPKTERLPNGAEQGLNSWPKLGYNGPAPPPGKVHRYIFHLFALSSPTGLPSGATAEQLHAAMKGKLLGEATWMGRYGR